MKVITALLAMLLVAACGQNSTPEGAESTMPADVLPAAQKYVDAVGRKDLEGLVNAFHSDGKVIDVSRTIAGHDAIRTWARNEVIGGTLRVLEIVEQRPDGQKLLVHWAPAGSDGFRAHYDFTSRDDRITVANLQYA